MLLSEVVIIIISKYIKTLKNNGSEKNFLKE